MPGPEKKDQGKPPPQEPHKPSRTIRFGTVFSFNDQLPGQLERAVIIAIDPLGTVSAHSLETTPENEILFHPPGTYTFGEIGKIEETVMTFDQVVAGLRGLYPSLSSTALTLLEERSKVAPVTLQ